MHMVWHHHETIQVEPSQPIGTSQSMSHRFAASAEASGGALTLGRRSITGSKNADGAVGATQHARLLRHRNGHRDGGLRDRPETPTGVTDGAVGATTTKFSYASGIEGSRGTRPVTAGQEYRRGRPPPRLRAFAALRRDKFGATCSPGPPQYLARFSGYQSGPPHHDLLHVGLVAPRPAC